MTAKLREAQDNHRREIKEAEQKRIMFMVWRLVRNKIIVPKTEVPDCI